MDTLPMAGPDKPDSPDKPDGSSRPDDPATERIPGSSPASAAGPAAQEPLRGPATPAPSAPGAGYWRSSPNRQWAIAGGVLVAVLVLGSTFAGGFVVASVIDGLRPPGASMAHHAPRYLQGERPFRYWQQGGTPRLHPPCQPVSPSTSPGGLGTP